MDCTDCLDSINAFVDGELLAEEQRDVREHLASCAECQSEHDVIVATHRTLKEGLVRYSAPDVLKARIRSALAQPDAFEGPVPAPRRAWPQLLAAGVIIAAASSALTFSTMRPSVARQTATSEILASHIRSLMPGHLVDVASTDQHNVKPWFNGRIDLSPVVPRLDSLGFPLVGGRIDYVAGRPVPAVVYGRRQHMINVFSWPSSDASALAPTTSTENGYHLVHWRNEGMEVWVVSDLNLAELQQFVAAFQRSDSAPAR